ncbi:OLC1v1031833C1 [Oldenlandia corymbosa var. corymbosa]|uniref:OLC1v1031833C1 n=1 Tax=Oldenlandia corymbosa var. corymbosa TaxID=529605 RepID=A0AAV1CK65_OLDCO|nr:OLC1v1031833C1 [Oldenlandia corymbosa var. corymbosa]
MVNWPRNYRVDELTVQLETLEERFRDLDAKIESKATEHDANVAELRSNLTGELAAFTERLVESIKISENCNQEKAPIIESIPLAIPVDKRLPLIPIDLDPSKAPPKSSSEKRVLTPVVNPIPVRRDFVPTTVTHINTVREGRQTRPRANELVLGGESGYHT